jgi:hypothetical protein
MIYQIVSSSTLRVTDTKFEVQNLVEPLKRNYDLVYVVKMCSKNEEVTIAKPVQMKQARLQTFFDLKFKVREELNDLVYVV